MLTQGVEMSAVRAPAFCSLVLKTPVWYKIAVRPQLPIPKVFPPLEV